MSLAAPEPVDQPVDEPVDEPVAVAVATGQPAVATGQPAIGPDPVAAGVPDEAVRLALELAFGVALLGARQRPPLAVPAGLRPFLRFQRLPPAALGPLRRAVEADDAFRQRVASVADESIVGRAGALWLRRPDGWEAALADALAEAAEAAEPEPSGAGRRQRDDARAERAERAAARAAAEVAAAHQALAAERERQAAGDAERSALVESLARLERVATELHRRVEAAERVRAEATDRAVAAEHVRAGIAARVAELEVQVQALAGERAELADALALAEREVSALVAAPQDRTPKREAAEGPRPDPPRPRDDLAERVAPLVADAAGAVADLARVLHRLGGELAGRHGPGTRPPGPPRPPGGPKPPTHRHPASPPVPAAPASTPRPARRPPQPASGRVPAPLPPRVGADSPEAAQHLLRRPGAVVLVDGYNVAKTAFPGAKALADERDWLADVLDELAARLGGDLRVVFDGADVPPVPARRRAVQVLFSPAGVTADDVIVELTNGLPRQRSVIVVTNDLALRERVKIYGANVLAAEQLLAAARR